MTVISSPPKVDEYGLSEYQRMEIRQEAIRAAAEATNTNYSSFSEQSKYVVEIAKVIEHYIVTGNNKNSWV